MGQTTSIPARVGEDVDDSRRRDRSMPALRRMLPERRRQEHEYDQDGLLNRGAHSRSTTWTSAQRTRRRSLSRLSQMILRNEDSATSIVSQEQSGNRRSELLHRTRSRLNDLIHRRGGSYSLPLGGISRTRGRVPFDWQDHRDATGENTPRLPSIDLASTFDDDLIPPRSSHGTPPSSVSRDDGPRMRFPTRASRRPDPLLNPIRNLSNNLTSSLRRRRLSQRSLGSTRPRGTEDQAVMLSQLLSWAAAATAATLMGDDPNAIQGARSLTNGTGLGDLAGGGEDGSFEGFLSALRNGRIASALRQGTNDGDADNDGAPTPPLNFYRMFRFGPSSTTPETPREGEGGENDEPRLVPIIIVGIRSVPQGSGANGGNLNEDLPPFINALSNFPTPLAANALDMHDGHSIDALLSPPQNASSFRARRRASMGGIGMGRNRLSDRMDDQRGEHPSPDRRRERPWSVASSSNFEPRPPPATPASPSPELSRISSRDTTPNPSRPASMIGNSTRGAVGNDSRRNSLLHRISAASPLSSHTEETASLHSARSSTNLLGDLESFRSLHRRSDTAPSNIHLPRFASGHPRRNGFVEPSNPPSLSRTASHHSDIDAREDRDRDSTAAGAAGGSTGSRSGDTRSWIIYVLGGSYPETHPILTTPSLFTENPTYEDMMLLSALLGPAKAPVATAEAVQSAGGIYNIVAAAEISEDAAKTAELVAVAITAASTDAEGKFSDAQPQMIPLEPTQRCLVCLSDFERADVARKLATCHHLFHRECIDQWLTTGRNSCPLCRTQGVGEVEEEKGDGAAAVSTTEEQSIDGAQEAAASFAASRSLATATGGRNDAIDV